MPAVSDSIDINKPAPDVFAALADPTIQVTYDGEMFKAVEQLTPGPIGRNTHFRGTFKGMGKVEYSYDEYEPDRLIQHLTKMPFGVAHHRFELAPTSIDSSKLTQTITLEPNLLGRLLWPLMMKRTMTGRVRTLNGLVKSYVESR